jgi:hypothetical protein
MRSVLEESLGRGWEIKSRHRTQSSCPSSEREEVKWAGVEGVRYGLVYNRIFFSVRATARMRSVVD